MNRSVTILFLDDDAKSGQLFLRFIKSTPYQCEVFQDARKALVHFHDHGANLIITDLRMPGMSGIDFLKAVRDRDRDVPVIITTAYASLDAAIEALRFGANDFLKKPYDLEELLVVADKTLEHSQLRQENRLLRRQLQDERLRYNMVGNSSAMQKVYRLIEKLAEVTCNVIIEGESGTGKELAARAIHNLGPRRDDSFIVIDCGGISDTLLESELFGHLRGAFTGADANRVGLLEAAGSGTVFLDEIGNISDNMQMKLLRVLQEGTVTPVGSTRSVSIRARFITATNQNLRSLVDQGDFRLDVYHRLNVVTLYMPSLEERSDDIPSLLEFFAAEFAEKYQRPLRHFSVAKIQSLCRRRWEGNVRELRNYVERCVIMAEGNFLDMIDEIPSTQLANEVALSHAQAASQPQGLEQLEVQHIRQVLDSVGGNQTKAARLLGINRTTLWRKLRQSSGN